MGMWLVHFAERALATYLRRLRRASLWYSAGARRSRRRRCGGGRGHAIRCLLTATHCATTSRPGWRLLAAVSGQRGGRRFPRGRRKMGRIGRHAEAARPGYGVQRCGRSGPRLGFAACVSAAVGSRRRYWWVFCCWCCCRRRASGGRGVALRAAVEFASCGLGPGQEERHKVGCARRTQHGRCRTCSGRLMSCS